MSKLLIGVVPVFLWAAGATAGELPVAHTIDLNVRGALEAAQRTNPVHYEKITKIAQGLLEQPDHRTSRWVQTTFNARNVSYPQTFLTSFPAQRRLSFTLDDTHYLVTLTMKPVGGIAVRNSK